MVTLTIVYLHMYIVTVICTARMFVVIAYHVILYAVQFFFHHQNAVHIGGVISEAYRMMETTPTNLSPTHLLQPFAPLTKGSSYPVFNKYPNFIVDYQVQ